MPRDGTHGRPISYPENSYDEQDRNCGARRHAGADAGPCDLTVSDNGAIHIASTITASNAIKKVEADAYKSLAISVRIMSRNPRDSGAVSKVWVQGISLVDRPDDTAFALAKAVSSVPGPYITALRRIDDLACAALDLGARLGAYETAARR